MKFLYIVIAFIFCSLPNTLFSQKVYEKGYIILNSGDTMNGYVLDRDDDKQELFEKIRFKSDGSGRRKKYSANDLAGYGYGNQQFVTMSIDQESRGLRTQLKVNLDDKNREFIKVVVRGKVSYYLREFIDHGHDDGSYIENIGYFLKEDEAILQRANQGIFGLKKKQLSTYFEDCPSLVTRLNENGFDTPWEVANFYNDQCAEEMH